MSKQSILITGASSGIGRATAIYLAKNGYTVYTGVRKEKDAQSLAQENLPNLIPVILDVTKPEDIQRVYDQISKEVGEQGLFALINNAGINYAAPFEFSLESESRKIMEVNVFGAINMSQKFFGLLQQYKLNTGKNSHMINVGSIGSVVGLPWEYIYHVSKFAVYGFSKSLRIELDNLGIKVSCVMPGAINTDLFEKTVSDLGPSFKQAGINQQYYVKGMQKTLDVADQLKNQSLPPIAVAKVIDNILKKQNPRLKNLVGLDAKLMNFMELYLPESWFRFILKKVAIPK
jgi:short-subunit dehydrogenase